jgi:hypothetical protein
MVESFTINRIPHEIRASRRKALHFRNASLLIFAYATDGQPALRSLLVMENWCRPFQDYVAI